MKEASSENTQTQKGEKDQAVAQSSVGKEFMKKVCSENKEDGYRIRIKQPVFIQDGGWAHDKYRS